jgi:O-antigen/teichoic acid export membrane protein
MGAEAYGLIGFFTMLQAWFGLLDMGLTPTIARETARYHGGSMTALNYRQLFRSLTIIFIAIALFGGGGMLLSAHLIADKWLNISELEMTDVVFAVQVMAISVALRWLSGLYRGVITGSERLVWLSVFNVIIATLRFVAVFITMVFYGFTPVVFFLHQLAVAVIEFFGLLLMTNKLKPKLGGALIIGWSFSPVKPILKFALTIAFTSSVWVLVTQTDKLILSGILPLAEYGYFTLAVLVAGGIMIIGGPISNAIMPRMARLYAEGKRDEMITIYRNSTQMVSVIAGSAAITIAFTAESLLFAWTGDKKIAVETALILRLYALGNGLLIMTAFPYYLQYALGNLRYHLIGNVITVVTLIPVIIVAATFYGSEGAAYAWLGVNFLYFVFWVRYVHSKIMPGLHRVWILRDCLSIYIPVLIILSIFLLWGFESNSRWLTFFYLIVVSGSAIFSAVFSSSLMREYILARVKKWMVK